MPNDTPDYQPGANYVAVPRPAISVSSVQPGPFTINVAAYTSVLVEVSAGPLLSAEWLDSNGATIGWSRLHEVVRSGQNVGYIKLPCYGPTLKIHWEVGTGTFTVFGGQETLAQAVLVGDGGAVTDTTYTESLNYLGATTAGTGILLGQTISSGRCWLNWSFSNTAPGYIQAQTFRFDGSQVNINAATAAQATGFVGSTVSAYQGFINLPAQVVSWYWVPNATNASGQSCVLTLIRG